MSAPGDLFYFSVAQAHYDIGERSGFPAPRLSTAAKEFGRPFGEGFLACRRRQPRLAPRGLGAAMSPVVERGRLIGADNQHIVALVVCKSALHPDRASHAEHRRRVRP